MATPFSMFTLGITSKLAKHIPITTEQNACNESWSMTDQNNDRNNMIKTQWSTENLSTQIDPNTYYSKEGSNHKTTCSMNDQQMIQKDHLTTGPHTSNEQNKLFKKWSKHNSQNKMTNNKQWKHGQKHRKITKTWPEEKKAWNSWQRWQLHQKSHCWSTAQLPWSKSLYHPKTPAPVA